MRKIKNLEDVFPVWKIEQDCILDKQGSITLAYELTLPEIFTLSSADYEAMHNAWVRAIKVLPIGTLIHKQDWFLNAGYRADFNNPTPSFLSHASERFFNERPFLDHDSYLYITLPPVGKSGSNLFSSSLIYQSLVEPSQLDPKTINTFLDKTGQFTRILSENGLFAVRRILEDELSSSEQSVGLIERYCCLSGRDHPRIVCDLQIGEGLTIGNAFSKVFSLCDPTHLPAICGPRINYDPYSSDKTKHSIGFASPLGLLLPINHIYNQFILVQDETKIIREQEKKRLRLQSLSAYSRANSVNRDAVNLFLNEAVQFSRVPVKAHYSLIAFTEMESELRALTNAVTAAFSAIDATSKIETDAAAQLYWAGIPGNAYGLPLTETFDTFIEQAACFLISETNYRSSVSPVGIRLGDRLSGLPVHVDISDEPILKGICTNRNKFVLGPSGSGKSVFCNHLIRSYVEQSAHAVIVDVGHSYRGLCELLNGYYFTYSESDPIRFNPFWLEGELDTEKKESIKTLLLALWKKDDETFTRSEYVALSNALESYYKTVPSFACFNSFYEFLVSGFSETLKSEKVKEKDFDIDNFLYVLKPFYRGGEFDYLLNATENLDMLDQPLIVFELDNIKDHPILFPVVTLVIMDVFIAKMRKLKGVRKIILIEEAWKAIAARGMAEYIKYLFKTVRKFFGEAIVVTQDVEDIISSPVVKDAIINNSDCKILLDQSKYLNKFHVIQELLGLTEKEKTLVLSLNKANDPKRKYKEVFISLGGSYSKVYRAELSLEEYLSYTTEEKEKVQVQAYAKKYGSLQKGIKVLAQHLNAA